MDFFNTKYNLLTILGPTATGKTNFAVNLAYNYGGEILSADSRQVYKNMDIGTGKDLKDYFINNEEINYHLIDIREAGTKYNLFEYQRDFFRTYKDVVNRGKTPILCGGTGLYIDAVVNNYDLREVPKNEKLRTELAEKSLAELSGILRRYKKLHNVSEIDTRKRAIRAIEIEEFLSNNEVVSKNYPQICSLILGLSFDRQIIRDRITKRLIDRLQNGLVEEVEQLMKDGVDDDTLIYYGLEYKFVTNYLRGVYSWDKMKELLNIAIHQFSKRQTTWFRRMERKGTKIWWIDGNLEMSQKMKMFEEILKKASL